MTTFVRRTGAILVLTFMVLVALSHEAFAASVGSASTADGPAFIGGLAWGPGIVKSQTSIESRKIVATNAHALAGWKFKDFAFGVLGQYSLVEQTTDPADVSNTNMASKGYSAGAGASYTYDQFMVQVSYDFMGNQELKKKNLANQTVSYERPIGFTFILSYMYTPKFSVDLMYGSHKYSETKIGGTTASISSDKLTENLFGVGFGIKY